MSFLEIKNVEKEFGPVKVLRGVNLSVNEHQVVCLIGASGCGKSTLLRIVAGFEAASEGQVLMAGSPVDGPGPDRGMVFQDYGLFPWLSVRQNIAFGPAARGLPRAKVTGDVEYATIEMHLGAIVQGRLVHQGAPAKSVELKLAASN